MKYCTIIENEDTRIKFIYIAEAMGLKVHRMTKYNSIDFEHIKKHKSNYYLILQDNNVNWDIDHLYISSGKIVDNELFINKMYLSSL